MEPRRATVASVWGRERTDSEERSRVGDLLVQRQPLSPSLESLHGSLSRYSLAMAIARAPSHTAERYHYARLLWSVSVWTPSSPRTDDRTDCQLPCCRASHADQHTHLCDYRTRPICHNGDSDNDRPRDRLAALLALVARPLRHDGRARRTRRTRRRRYRTRTRRAGQQVERGRDPVPGRVRFTGLLPLSSAVPRALLR